MFAAVLVRMYCPKVGKREQLTWKLLFEGRERYISAQLARDLCPPVQWTQPYLGMIR